MRIKAGQRLLWLSLCLFFLFGSLGWRCYDLQLADGAELARMAVAQRQLAVPVQSRGLVLDRNGHALSDATTTYGVAWFPPLVKDPAGTARTLSGLLGRATAVPQGDPQWVAQGLDEKLAANIAGLNLPGIAVGPLVTYGPDALAHHLAGYANSMGGQSGLQAAFDEELSGSALPSVLIERDGEGRVRRTGAFMPVADKAPANLVTTVDSRIQAAVEQVLDRHAGLRGAAVVLDPRSGEVLAMASRPTFAYGGQGVEAAIQAGGAPLLNRAVTAYPPGSVFKPIVAAAALESGKVTMDEQFSHAGSYSIGNDRFQDADKESHAGITFREAIARSCNITFLRVGNERLGLAGLRQAALQFGFGAATNALGQGRTWQDEQVGTVPRTAAEGLAQVAFGQGKLTVTPLQVARAYAAIVNGGVLPAVRLVTAVKSPAGEVLERPAAGQGKRVMSPETAAKLERALLEVTEPGGVGTGQAAWIPGVGSGGKTGTAEVSGKTSHAWFAGFFPALQPRYVVVVLVEEGGYGGKVAAPIFREIGGQILSVTGR